MQAPDPKATPELGYERVRCSCRTETMLVFPKRWYHGQEDVEEEASCPGCGRWLVAYTHPTGAVVATYTFERVPDAVAKALGAELADEILRGRLQPITDGVPERWNEPHEAPEAYVEWLGTHRSEPEPFMERRLVIQNLAITAVLVVITALLVVT